MTKREELLDQNWKDAEEFCRGAFGHFVIDVSQYTKIVAELMEHATNRALGVAQAPIDVRKISDMDMRELLSAKDVGKGRAVLKRILSMVHGGDSQ